MIFQSSDIIMRAIPICRNVPNYRRLSFEKMERHTSFNENTLAQFVHDNNIREVPDVSDRVFKKHGELLGKMSAMANRMVAILQEATSTSNRYDVEDTMAKGVLAIKEIAHERLPPNEAELYINDFDKIVLLIEEWRNSCFEKKEEKFIPTHQSYFKVLVELRQYEKQYSRQLSPSFLILLRRRIAIAQLKIELFNCWTTIETCKLVIGGLRALDRSILNKVWHVMLLKPIRSLQFAPISELNEAVITKICKLFAPCFCFASRYTESARNRRMASIFVPPAQGQPYFSRNLFNPISSSSNVDVSGSSTTRSARISNDSTISPPEFRRWNRTPPVNWPSVSVATVPRQNLNSMRQSTSSSSSQSNFDINHNRTRPFQANSSASIYLHHAFYK